MIALPNGGPIVYLAYMDDSDTKQKSRKFQVLCAVIVPDLAFFSLEMNMSTQIESVIPKDRLERFEEFKACELFGGYGIFEGIDQEIRFAAIESLLHLTRSGKFPIVYGATDLERLKSHPVFSSANSMDMAFRLCTDGIEYWLVKTLRDTNPAKNMVLLIADDCDKEVKTTMRRTFKELRPKLGPHVYDSVLRYYERMKPTPKTPTFARFTDAVRQMLTVPKTEILRHEAAAKEARKATREASASGRASRAKER